MDENHHSTWSHFFNFKRSVRYWAIFVIRPDSIKPSPTLLINLPLIIGPCIHERVRCQLAETHMKLKYTFRNSGPDRANGPSPKVETSFLSWLIGANPTRFYKKNEEKKPDVFFFNPFDCVSVLYLVEEKMWRINLFIFFSFLQKKISRLVT
jgi:hypothetical protein